MYERDRHIPDRVADKLQNNYEPPVPQGGVLCEDLWRGLIVVYQQQGKDENKARVNATALVRKIRKTTLLEKERTTKNPDSVKNLTTDHFLTPRGGAQLLSPMDPDDPAVKEVFKKAEQIEYVRTVVLEILSPED